MKLVLASKSPRRKEILSMVTSDFTVRVSDANEEYDKETPLNQVPRILAERKAMAVEIEEDEIIIGCDTVVVYGNELMGKPSDKNEAIRMLKMLSGTVHQVISGISLRSKDKLVSDSVVTYVRFKDLSDMEIERYVNKFNPIDKAGAYGIQESAGAFVVGIEGDFYNVVGLPLCHMCQMLKNEFDEEIL